MGSFRNQSVERILPILIDRFAPVADEKLLEEKGLRKDGNFTELYYTVYRNYRMALDAYVVQVLNLGGYDRRISESDLLFVPVSEEDMDFYQYISTFGLDYFYLRSETYVEKLSAEDIEYFSRLTKAELPVPSEKTMERVEKTWRSVIDIGNDDGTIHMCRYGPDTDRFWFPSTVLILGFRYDMFADVGLGQDEEWLKNNDKQILFLNDLFLETEERFQSLNNMEAGVIWYHEYVIDMPVSVLLKEGNATATDE